MSKKFVVYYPQMKTFLGKNRPMLTKNSASRFQSVQAASTRADNIARMFSANEIWLKNYIIQHERT